jgi:hypothetical protein
MASASRQFLVATFASENTLRDAARRLKDSGVHIYDAYTPYPVHGLSDLIGVRPSRLPLVALAGGIAGCVGAFAMQFYMAVFDWPLDVGGKPPNSTLAFVPIAFELTILCAGLATAVAFLLRSRLVPGVGPEVFADGTNEDVFALALRRRDATFDSGETERLLLESGATQIALKEVAR